MAAPGRKVNKERLTFLGCANASGTHMLKLLVIGKAKNPRSFGNTRLPVEYASSSNAWMTSAIFENWFHKSLIPQVREFLTSQNLPQKALLLLDNAPCHPPIESLTSPDKQIYALFLPANTTALLQAMDQDIIRLTKLYYKRNLLAHILNLQDKDISLCLKQVSLKDAVFFLASLKPDVVKKCWNPLLKQTKNDDWGEEDDLPLSVLRETLLAEESYKAQAEVQNIVQGLSKNRLSNQEISDWIEENIEIPLIENEDETSDVLIEPVARPRVSHSEAINSLNVAIDWATANDISASDVMVLYNLKEKAEKLCLNSKKQKKLSDLWKDN